MAPGAADDQELQVIPRRPHSLAPPLEADMSGSLDGQTGWAPARKRRLAGIVAVAIVGCAGILVAAGIAHFSRSKAAGPATASSATTTPSDSKSSPLAPSMASAAASTAPLTAPAPATETATGNLILVRPAVRGYVWLDGQKISTVSSVVSCGPHKIKVGSWGHPHAITVPCGADLKVWH